MLTPSPGVLLLACTRGLASTAARTLVTCVRSPPRLIIIYGLLNNPSLGALDNNGANIIFHLWQDQMRSYCGDQANARATAHLAHNHPNSAANRPSQNGRNRREIQVLQCSIPLSPYIFLLPLYLRVRPAHSSFHLTSISLSIAPSTAPLLLVYLVHSIFSPEPPTMSTFRLDTETMLCSDTETYSSFRSAFPPLLLCVFESTSAIYSSFIPFVLSTPSNLSVSESNLSMNHFLWTPPSAKTVLAPQCHYFFKSRCFLNNSFLCLPR